MCPAVLPAGHCAQYLPQERIHSTRSVLRYQRGSTTAAEFLSAGVTGQKPTYGTVSRYELITYGSSLDRWTGSEGCDGLCGGSSGSVYTSYIDKGNTTSVKRASYDFTSALEDDAMKGMRIGIPSDYMGEGLEAEVH